MGVPIKLCLLEMTMKEITSVLLLALVSVALSSPVREDDVVPETNFIGTGSGSSSASGSGSYVGKPGHCKTGKKVDWWTKTYKSSAPEGNDLALKNRVVNECQTHCTTNLGGAKRCGGKIDEHELSQEYGRNKAQCNCNSAFKAAAMSMLAIAVVLANIKNHLW